MAIIADPVDELCDQIWEQVDQLRKRCVVSDEAMKHMNELYELIWIEACYDSTNAGTKKLAERLLSHIKALNDEFGFHK